MEFGILGPLEVRDADRPLPLGGAKQRALLAILLLNANRVVSIDRLLDALWGEQPPASGAKALHVYVSQLRKVVGEERVVTAPTGYMLRIDAAELVREALALWRGPALADFTYEPFAQGEIARLEELRTGAIEQRIDADIA